MLVSMGGTGSELQVPLAQGQGSRVDKRKLQKNSGDHQIRKLLRRYAV